ncbi:hypothetical protein GTO27_02825 [Candidatus Bathyarchaeota archaeon]|nr:hypothetical protein [Candidatus Bathyarchaeota archaeon]
MLGKLTRWLRILGLDVKYSNELDDAELIANAKEDTRILLTKDLNLYRQAIAKNVDAFYLEGRTRTEKLANIAKKFKIQLNVDMTRSRCPKCNQEVEPIAKQKVRGRVKESTFKYYNEFWKCPKCSQIYWQGAHWERIRSTLEATKEKIGRKNKG